jgi:hypothetical protein
VASVLTARICFTWQNTEDCKRKRIKAERDNLRMVKITYAKLYVSTVIKVTFHVKYFILLSLTIKIKKLFGKYQVLNGKGFTVSPLFAPGLKKKKFYSLFSEIV